MSDQAPPPPPRYAGASADVPVEVSTEPASTGPDRRGVIVGLAVTAVAGVAGYAVASRDRTVGPSSGTVPAPAPAGNAATAPAAGGGAKPLVALADVPSDGGFIAKDERVVVTRDGDTVRAFSAVCTHQGCTVSSVSGGTINCPCHGSKFDAATGDVVGGPAPRPLEPVNVRVQGGKVFRA